MDVVRTIAYNMQSFKKKIITCTLHIQEMNGQIAPRDYALVNSKV
jgi:hypothetical protein